MDLGHTSHLIQEMAEAILEEESVKLELVKKKKWGRLNLMPRLPKGLLRIVCLGGFQKGE